MGILLWKMRSQITCDPKQPSNFNILLNEIKPTMMSITSVIPSPIVTAPSSKLAHQMFFSYALSLFLKKRS